ncbi:hypothetical protein [Symmachiella dynata]|nr:hypothetical protein [Symmachiella dynata]
MFHYASGEPVEIGDKVDYLYANGWHRHVVVSIFAPMTAEAEGFDCRETGGVFLADDTSATAGMLLMPPDRDDWDEVKFIGRAQS